MLDEFYVHIWVIAPPNLLIAAIVNTYE